LRPPLETIGFARCPLEDLAVIAGFGNDLGGPVMRQSQRLSGREIMAEQLLGSHVFPMHRGCHVGLCDPQRLRLDQRTQGPVHDQSEGLIAIEVGGNDGVYAEALRQKREIAGQSVEVGARLDETRLQGRARLATTDRNSRVHLALFGVRHQSVRDSTRRHLVPKHSLGRAHVHCTDQGIAQARQRRDTALLRDHQTLGITENRRSEPYTEMHGRGCRG